ncbi:MAG: T9SS type A sorting domain-containing protein [Anaerolineales bacterium]|nr:T9SS type A sorting domain-containing protein [Anaerolineales bacterium]
MPIYDYDRRSAEYYRDTLNLAFPTSDAVYTAASGGYPVGDLNWFPARYTAWKNDPSTDVEEQGASVPEEFALAQNFPNPFNPTTQISFTLGQASKVTLEVYNLLGQRVAMLIDGQLRAAGKHEAQFQAIGLASGVYFYRLTAGENMATMKMMLVR